MRILVWIDQHIIIPNLRILTNINVHHDQKRVTIIIKMRILVWIDQHIIIPNLRILTNINVHHDQKRVTINTKMRIKRFTYNKMLLEIRKEIKNVEAITTNIWIVVQIVKFMIWYLLLFYN